MQALTQGAYALAFQMLGKREDAAKFGANAAELLACGTAVIIEDE